MQEFLVTRGEIEQILNTFKDQKIANFLNLEQVNFRVTLIKVVLGGEHLVLCIHWFGSDILVKEPQLNHSRAPIINGFK